MFHFAVYYKVYFLAYMRQILANDHSKNVNKAKATHEEAYLQTLDLTTKNNKLKKYYKN